MNEHYIAIDWSQQNMAIARMTGRSEKVTTFEGPSDVRGIQAYLKGLAGSKTLTVEESTGSQWLYTELKPYVDKMIVCDPYRNRLLSEGAKNDKIDSIKLVQLLKGGMLKEVFHNGDDFIYLRRMASGYDDLVEAGVRLKNQRSALFRGRGAKAGALSVDEFHEAEGFVVRQLESMIDGYELRKKDYEKEFHRLSKKYQGIGHLKSLSGIADIHAVQIAARVVDARRFPSSGHFLSYCGLVKHEKISGGKSYGKRNSRYCRPLKRVFKLAAYSVIQERCNNPMRSFYQMLIDKKRLPDHVARNAIARRIAVLAYGILKSGKKFNPHLAGGDEKTKT